jgi:hypothetical protein
VGTVGVGERTVALTGVFASGAAGDVVETNSPTEDGVVAQGEVGTVSPDRTVALTGGAASGSVGTVDFSYVAFLSGVVGSGSVGTVGSSRTMAMSGVQASGQVGTPNYFYWTVIDDNQTPNWQNVAMTV